MSDSKSSGSATAKMFQVRVTMSVDYDIPVKAYSAEQAAEYVDERFRYGLENPDEVHWVDSTFEDVDAVEDEHLEFGDEEYDATDEPPKPKKPKKKKKPAKMKAKR